MMSRTTHDKQTHRPLAGRSGFSRVAGLSFFVLVLVGVAVWVAMCSETDPWAKAPEGFVEVQEGPFVFKAVSPDGSVIGVRHRLNKEEGDLAFWLEVFELEMVDAKGYKLEEKREVRSADGVDGVLMRFAYAQGDTPFHYGLAVFVTEKTIITLETATELGELERYNAAFEEALESVQVKLVE